MDNTHFQNIKSLLKNFPKSPGCYIMKDKSDKIFYIGKAKNIKSRLRSYFNGQDKRSFVQFLHHTLKSIETIIVNSEKEALILERELIRKHKPRFNISLKDDKNYILLCLKNIKPNKKESLHPRLLVVRNKKIKDAKYFGPFPSANHLRQTLSIINKHFTLRTCSDQILNNRQRPCIQYQIKRCSAPCVYDVKDYKDEVENVISFLQGNFSQLKKKLTEKMWEFSENESFEKASKLRDQIKAIDLSLENQNITRHNAKGLHHYIGFAKSEQNILIVIVIFNDGQYQSIKNYYFANNPLPDREILENFLSLQYFNDDTLKPNIIFVPNFAIKDHIKTLKELTNLNIKMPQKGANKKLLTLANKNAVQILKEKLSLSSSNFLGLQEIQSLLKLSFTPKNIHCIDISLIQGSDPVGSVVVFNDGMPNKNLYRQYGIKSVTGMDDFAMIREVILRHYKQAATIKDDLPDLLLIDGGKGQLSSALSALNELGIILSHQQFFVASIAKARAKKDSKERLFLPNVKEPIILQEGSKAKNIITHIRDEAHRFALKSHRIKRKNRTLKSSLLNVPSIGPKTAQLLFKYFSSIDDIFNASYEELKKAGLNAKQIEAIKSSPILSSNP